MASRSFSHFVEQEMGKFPHFVIYVLLEWVLIIILFLDGFLAFIANEFAMFFELQIPCWLCTRFDHVMAHRNPDFYYNESVCETHKKDMSSLAFCHNHKKLSDIRKMCEGCLLSFATEKESDCDTYKSLVGILHKDLECFVQDGQPIQLSLKDDGFMHVDTSSTQRCSCCGKPLKVKASYVKGKRSASFARAPTPSPRAFPYSTSKSEDHHGLELPHIRYTELKFMSDDSELPEDEDSFNANKDLNDESSKFTPTFTKSNKFFGIPLTDSANNSPRWSYRIARKSPLEKTEFASDSNEANVQNDADEAILNNLKRQVRLDRKSLMALYMELDEERSASAVAANNAMAMITRLQAEKAAVQMEALQYQRMMEEQAEYDEEALQACNDMLLKREEDMKSLETELEIYRKKYGSLVEEYANSSLGDNGFSLRLNEGEDNNGEKSFNYNQVVSSPAKHGGVKHSDSFKEIMAERTYLLGRLKKIEPRTPFAENIETGKGSEAYLPKELSFLAERVKALEANSGFLELVSKKDENDSEGTEILTVISQNLEKLNNLVMTSFEDMHDARFSFGGN
ncbi:probable myosin-binding protein 5 [Abrus precatorius]|uniref:Probable myosin-binding protein 5 n=1 Tax=Abrus precatorius TaxID=3816 RepID=A0A8B8K4A7_ABRPR|nr:probable myosin-binding protein 5 [Abrus precatorius]